MTEQKGSKKLKMTLIICITVVLLAAIGSWVYVQRQQIAQKDRALAQQKQLNEYDQAQLNARNQANVKAECQQSANSLKSSGVYVSPFSPSC